MNTAHGTWTIASAAEAAQARTAAARLTATAGASPAGRARFLTAVTGRLRQCLAQGGAWDLRLSAHHTGTGADGHIEVTVREAGRSPGGRPPWRLTLACPDPVRTDSPGPEPAQGPAPVRADAPDPTGLDGTDMAEALLAADEDTAELLDRLDAQEGLVRFHRDELHQTNQGVLALHAELDAAALAQRDLLTAERAARAAADNARRLLTFLADASDAVTASLDPEDILRRLPGLLVPRYARRADLWLFDDDPAPHHGHRPAAAVVAARTGRPQHAAPHAGDLPGVDDLPPSALTPAAPLLCVPLLGPRPLGVLILTSPGPRFDPDEAVMLVELARRTGIALDNARRYAQQRDTAEALQRAQLTDLPTTPQLRLAARYLPATRGLNIGGDWYDAFPQPDGSLLAVIGDVTGHGLRAAVMMGQLRTALRAYAVEGDSPAGILTRLHRLLRHQQPDVYATAVLARFRPGDPTVVWAAAGHPPAVTRTPDGTVRVLDTKPGIMLGVPLPHVYQDHRVRLAPGSTLLLYTDGLVERRDQGIDAGVGRLTRAMAALSPTELEQDLDAAAESLLTPMLHDSGREDDVCLLLCRTSPDRPSSPGTPHRGAEPG
ncbi:GAF domain-containing SpoIIE family protein phosphatase [Streptomyces sp. NPDC052682]|uniref:PP2C family protein-serine/threonine phosphatase n=1 Tax=Streptomyces sp. NPDC052682 TaxID=3154954 RepID=UPI0034346C1D